MSRFLYRLVLFFVCSGAFCCAIDVITTALLHKSESFTFGIWNKLLNNRIQSDLIILGDSRAWTNYNPVIIDSALHISSYDLGISGRKAETSILTYHTYMQHTDAPPRYVVFDIYYGTMCTTNGYGRSQFTPYFNNDSLMQTVRTLEHFSWADYHVPFYRYFRHRELFYNELVFLLKHPVVEQGHYTFNTSWNPTVYNTIDHIDYSHDTSVLCAVRAMLDECTTDCTQVILVHSPFYIGATNKISDTSDMWNMFRNLAREYNLTLLDYSHHPLSYDTNNFYDAHHLNVHGANRFSRLLAHDLDSLGIGK